MVPMNGHWLAGSRSMSKITEATRDLIANENFAFPKQRKEPIHDAAHVRNAIARFDQVKEVSDEDREQAFHHIKTAAKKFGVEMTETHWSQLGSKPHTSNTAHKKAC